MFLKYISIKIIFAILFFTYSLAFGQSNETLILERGLLQSNLNQVYLTNNEYRRSNKNLGKIENSNSLINFALKTGVGYATGISALVISALLYQYASNCKNSDCGLDAFFFGIVFAYPLGSAFGVYGMSKILNEPCSLNKTIIGSYLALPVAPALPVVSAAVCNIFSDEYLPIDHFTQTSHFNNHNPDNHFLIEKKSSIYCFELSFLTCAINKFKKTDFLLPSIDMRS